MVLKCHCHQMSCSRRDSDRGSTCIIGCLKSDGERYNWSDGYCTCKLCRCKCKKAFAMDSIARIGIALTQKKDIDLGIDTSVREDKDRATASGNRIKLKLLSLCNLCNVLHCNANICIIFNNLFNFRDIYV